MIGNLSKCILGQLVYQRNRCLYYLGKRFKYVIEQLEMIDLCCSLKVWFVHASIVKGLTHLCQYILYKEKTQIELLEMVHLYHPLKV